MQYDLLVKGGHVIDPGNGIDAKLDVAIKDGKIAAVDRQISGAADATVADVSGLYVMPGLIDLHTHSYGYAGWTFPDEYAFPNGVTTVVDAGGAGYKSFEDFKNTIIDKARVRLLVLLNIVGAGMLGPVEQDVSEMRPEPVRRIGAPVSRNHRRDKGGPPQRPRMGIGRWCRKRGRAFRHRGDDRLFQPPGPIVQGANP